MKKDSLWEMNMMRTLTLSVAVIGLVLNSGCEKSTKNGSTSSTKPAATNQPQASKPVAHNPAPRVKFTSENNPTSKSGRGLPDLNSTDRPAAWAFVDGIEGEYRMENGRPLLQWFIDGPVSATPIFRIEVYEPLIGDPKDFQCALQSNSEGNPMIYAMKAEPGTFNVGQDYNMLRPGDNFTILNKTTNEVVKEIPPLAPGKYGFVASIRRSEKDAGGEITSAVEALAVTYFTVGE